MTAIKTKAIHDQLDTEPLQYRSSIWVNTKLRIDDAVDAVVQLSNQASLAEWSDEHVDKIKGVLQTIKRRRTNSKY